MCVCMWLALRLLVTTMLAQCWDFLLSSQLVSARSIVVEFVLQNASRLSLLSVFRTRCLHSLSGLTGNLSTREEQFRAVFKAAAGSVYLITFDIRHLSGAARYNEHWRLRFFVNDTLDPGHNDSIDCGELLKRTGQNSEQRHLVVDAAQRTLCVEETLPPAFEKVAVSGGTPVAGGVFSFMLHALTDCEWRVEAQVLDGMFLPDAYMLSRVAAVEYAEPSRAMLGTPRLFGVVVRSSLAVELGSNMPLKTYPSDPTTQRVLTKAYLNWLPLGGDLDSHMLHPWRDGEHEYKVSEKPSYFGGVDQQVMIGHLALLDAHSLTGVDWGGRRQVHPKTPPAK